MPVSFMIQTEFANRGKLSWQTGKLIFGMESL
jgi:hypothetical protein